jgi:hypothetical protein
MIKLGDKVRDTISGFEGIATGRTTWLHGCERIGVQPQALHDGKPVENAWFDINQLEVVEKNSHQGVQIHTKNAGGPQDDPSSARSGE